MCKYEVDAIVLWAVGLANEHGVGVQGVIASFISVRNELGDNDLAKEFVENETKEMRRVMQ